MIKEIVNCSEYLLELAETKIEVIFAVGRNEPGLEQRISFLAKKAMPTRPGVRNVLHTQWVQSARRTAITNDTLCQRPDKKKNAKRAQDV